MVSGIRTLSRRGLAFFSGLLVLILIVEVSLVAVSSYRKWRDRDVAEPPQAGLSNPPVLRIAVLGESTSAPASDQNNRRIDWPFQLENILNSELEAAKETYRVKIFNLARPATSSPFQLALLQERASELDPDVIVSMMGVNDSSVENIERNFLYRNSFFFRLIYWSQVAWSCPRCYNTKMSGPDFEETLDAPKKLEEEGKAEAESLQALRAADIASLSDLAKFQMKIRELQKRYGKDSAHMNLSLGLQLLLLSSSPQIRDVKPDLEAALLAEAESLHLQSYTAMVTRVHWSVEIFCHIMNRQKRQAVCLEAIKRALANGAPATPRLLTVAAYSGAAEDPDLQKVFRSVGFSVGRANERVRFLRQTYRRLAEFANDRDALLFAMQYPTGSVEGLKFFFSDAPDDGRTMQSVFYMKETDRSVEKRYENVIFVSNESFKWIVSSKNSSEYFTDYFARDGGLNFGHTTEKGHEVIARNISTALRTNWSDVVSVADRRRRR